MSLQLMSYNPNPLSVLRLESAPMRAKQYMDSIIVDTAIREILDPLKTAYVGKAAAQSFIDAFSIAKQGFLKISLENDHRFAEWLEFGTAEHIIQPIGRGTDEGGKDMMYWTDSNGEHFRWIVHHPGFGGYRVIPHLLPGLINRFIIVLVKRTNEFLERSKLYE